MRALTLVILVLLLGCTNDSAPTKQNQMGENWQFFPCSMGEDQAFIYLNVSIDDAIAEAPQSLAKLRLTYKSTHPNGLPMDVEFEPVKEIEDRIEGYSKEADDWYVGRVTVSGHRIFYVYTSRGEPDWTDFVTTLSAESGYEIRLSLRDDPAHRGYHDDLFPTEDDWRVIHDLQVIEALARSGDDGSETRKVDHWVYFDTKASATDFVTWAESDRFTEDAEYSHPTDDGRYCVRLYHHGTVKIGDISSHTIALRRKAEEYGGDYDGWETLVVKPEESASSQNAPEGAPDG